MSERRAVEVVPIGEIGDGALGVTYDPNPDAHRSEFEIHYQWDDGRQETVYLGDKGHVLDLISVLAELVKEEP